MHLRMPGRAHPRSPALTAGVMGLAVLVLAGCSSGAGATLNAGDFQFSGSTAAGQVLPVADRAAAPPFRGELLDGQPFRSDQLAGSVAVLNFWGSWCAPCRKEPPDLQAVYADVRDRGVRFLGVDVKDQRQLASAFMADVGAEYPSLFDPRGEVALAFRGFPANVVPSTILLDERGDVAAVYTGAVEQEDLRAALDTLLQGSGP